MIKKDKFIEKSKEVHGDKYDYSKVEYKKVTDKVCIICPEHGEFWQDARNHYRGQGCPKCGVNKRSIKRSYDTEKFIEKSKEIHGDKYDYSLVEYVDSMTKVKLICPKHGEFLTRPDGHLCRKMGCPKCGNEKKGSNNVLTTEQFIEKARQLHDNKYDYSKVKYKNGRSRINIVCPEHGEFVQSASSHLMGHGCEKCYRERQAVSQTKTTEQFIEDAKTVHGDLYDYSKTEYNGCFEPVTIICPIHGEFRQKASTHLNGCGCQKCGVELSESKEEKELYGFCCDLIGEENVIKNDRSQIYPYEIDIYIPSMKIGIEYNGLYWHSDKKKDKNYHLNKLNMCKKNGIKLIQIFEDEYINKKNIVLGKISHLLKQYNQTKTVYGRKTTVTEIYFDDAKSFLDNNHIQGFAKSTVYLGAYFEDELIGVMSFIMRDNEWELTRFASKIDYKCCGVGGKMFSYFVKNYNPSYIKSFADRRWTIDEDNNLYKQIGFNFETYIAPDYKYFVHDNGIVRKHKFNFRKKILNKKYGFPLTMTESEMTNELGAIKIYDCGLIKYVWTN